ncbi:MAG TPA: alpha-L-rhamnosidase N-terminal domain-containing protein, partial [Opitutaceae bacterium]
MNRRDFLKASSAAGGALLLAGPGSGAPGEPIGDVPGRGAALDPLPDLAGAAWIWFPSGRTLPNSFILFRRPLSLSRKPRRARGWLSADSRYALEVNGRRIQWGPAPCDPRWAEADPIDLTESLVPGDNVLGATVLHYGVGEGTWPLGRPGFLFWLEIEHADGSVETVVSDSSWKAHLCRAWPPGRPKRWYLRALQEEFDARLFPHGWALPDFVPDAAWLAAMVLEGSPRRPALATNYPDYLFDSGSGPASSRLRPRTIPFLRETVVPAARLAETHVLSWKVTPEDYFDFRVPDAFRAEALGVATQESPGRWTVALDGARSVALTFEFTEQVVGWPGFTIEAPAGTVVELLVHEAHALGGTPLLNTHFDSWSRFVCRDGRNDFETFDFESLRWIQLLVRGATGTVAVGDVRVRRRVFPWPNEAHLRTSDPALQRLFDASLNTLCNCAQETLVDGMARERQQYSGDGGHQMHAVHLAYGETRLVARYLSTWSQGMTKDGYFLDCWPAYDRLVRLAERQLDLTDWGPILDHGVGFTFDCWHHYSYTGDLEALREPYPRLVRFARYLQGITGADGLLPVENLGIPWVWMDSDAYREQRHKQCAFNLYVAAAMRTALEPLCREFGDVAQADAVGRFATDLERATVARFWSAERGLFVNNRPWLEEEGSIRTCDRSLATSVLYGLCPGGQDRAALDSLASCPPEMGFSYP